ncbi:MAG: MATE family efflux transporter [Bacteroidota bacterium]
MKILSPINNSILKLAIPNIVTNITVPLLGIVDLALMGHLNNPVYIGAIALGSLIFNMIYSSFSFLRMGSSGMAAQAFGANLQQEISLVLIRSLLVAMGLAVLLILFQYPIQWISFKILDGSEAVTSLAIDYFNVRIWAAPATLGLMAFFGWFLGLQDAKRPMIIAIVINLVNIGLNFVFVLGFKMTSSGVALATVIAQYSGLLLAIFFLLTKYKVYIRKFSLVIILKNEAIIRFFKVNSDIFIRTILLLLTLAFFTNISAKEGDTTLAVNTILLQFFFIFSYFADGFAYAGEALTGKALGARDKKSLVLTVKHLFYWGGGAAVFVSLIFFVGLDSMLKLMTSNSDIQKVAMQYRMWIVIIPLASSAAFIWDGVFIGVTASKGMRNAMIIASIFVFLPTYYLTVNYWGNNALWLSLNLFMLARGLLMWIMWQRVKLW